ncbi:MAG: acyl-CoA thioester hydrolase/BAAT C-terminal domain-containing protein [Bacteroidota bacterium]
MKKRSLFLIGGLLILIVGYFVLDALLYTGIRSQQVSSGRVTGNWYAKPGIQSVPTVILLGEGSWQQYWAQELAQRGFAALELPYCCREGLPSSPEEIPLEYVAEAVDWLQQQPAVDPAHILIMGASRNAELALVAAANLPENIHGVIAYAPSSVSWANRVLPYNSDELKPSWTLQERPIPFVPMAKPAVADSISLLAYWERGLAKDSLNKAAIPVERISGPVLLFSGKDDQVWPAATMALQIEQRLEAHDFPHEVQQIAYDNAGHLISGNPDFLQTQRTGNMNLQGTSISYSFGGTAEGDQQAQLDAKARVLELLQRLKAE